jgi:hypothetical protein
MSPFTTEDLLREGVPILAILVVWTATTGLLEVVLAPMGFVNLAALVVAGLYAVVRGRQLTDRVEPVFQVPDLERTVRTAVRPLLPALVWFLLAGPANRAGAAPLVGEFLDAFRAPAAFVLAGTGVVTVLLFAVATGSATLRTQPHGNAFADD